MGGRQHLAPAGEREDGQGVLHFEEQPPVEDKPQVLPAIDSSSALEALLGEQLEALAPEDEDGYRGRLAILAEAVALVLEDCMGQASKTQALLIRTQRVNPTILAVRARWGEEEACRAIEASIRRFDWQGDPTRFKVWAAYVRAAAEGIHADIEGLPSPRRAERPERVGRPGQASRPRPEPSCPLAAVTELNRMASQAARLNLAGRTAEARLLLEDMLGQANRVEGLFAGGTNHAEDSIRLAFKRAIDDIECPSEYAASLDCLPEWSPPDYLFAGI